MTANRDNRASVPYLPKRDAGYRSANDEDDPYRAAAKPPEPTECPECHAVFNEGRWTWDDPPDQLRLATRGANLQQPIDQLESPCVESAKR